MSFVDETPIFLFLVAAPLFCSLFYLFIFVCLGFVSFILFCFCCLLCRIFVVPICDCFYCPFYVCFGFHFVIVLIFPREYFYFDALTDDRNIQIYLKGGIIHSSSCNTVCVGLQYEKYLDINGFRIKSRATDHCLAQNVECICFLLKINNLIAMFCQYKKDLH